MIFHFQKRQGSLFCDFYCLVYTTRREKSDSLFSGTIYQFDLNNLTFYFSFGVGRLQLNFNALKIAKRKKIYEAESFPGIKI